MERHVGHPNKTESHDRHQQTMEGQAGHHRAMERRIGHHQFKPRFIVSIERKRTIVIILIALLVAELSVVRCSSMTSRCPNQCRCSDKNSVVVCHRSGFSHVPPSLPDSLISLDLDHNRISLLQNGSFHRVRKLEVLSLQDNGILHLEMGVFDSMHELKILRLGRNHLSHLQKNLFVRNRKLQVLDLHANYFPALPEQVMHHLHSLQVLNMSFNHLTSLELGPGFQFSTELSHLDLSGNDFSSIESNAFDSMQFWDDRITRHINLSYCNIRHIHPQSLHRIPLLATISFEGNLHLSTTDLQVALADLPISLLENINLSHMNITDIFDFVRHFQPNGLRHLNLAFNRIQTIPKGTFFFFVSLRHLDLSHNDVSVIENLAGLSKLEYLSVAYNDLDRLHDMMFEGLHELKVIDVSHNRLTHLDDQPFLTLFNLHTIHAGRNQIQQIAISDGLESLETLRVGWNRVSSLRFIHRLRRLRILDASHNALTRLGEEVFARGQAVHCANFSGNLIDEISPSAFQHAIYNIIDISNNRLGTLSNYGWENNLKTLHANGNGVGNVSADAFRRLDSLTELHLQHNNLHWLPREVYADLRRLKVINLSSNPIGRSLAVEPSIGRLDRLETLVLRDVELETVTPSAFHKLTSLRRLDLARNKIRQLDPSAFAPLTELRELNLAHNRLQQIDTRILSQAVQLTRFDASSNPFDCTCQLISFCDQLFTSDATVVYNWTSYRCSTPVDRHGLSLAEYYADSPMQCSYFDRALIGAVAGCTAITVILTVSMAVFRYRSWRRRCKTNRSLPEYKFVDETSLTSSSCSNNPPTTTSNLTTATTNLKTDRKHWV